MSREQHADTHHLPGEVERDNDAQRPDEPGHGKRDSSAQSHAKREGKTDHPDSPPK